MRYSAGSVFTCSEPQKHSPMSTGAKVLMRLALGGFYYDFRIYFSKKPSGNFENKIYDSRVLEHRWHTRGLHSKVVGRDGGSIHLKFLQLQGSPSGNGDSFPPVTPLRGDSNSTPRKHSPKLLGKLDVYLGLSFLYWRNRKTQGAQQCGALLC